MPGRFSHDLQRTHEKSNAFRCGFITGSGRSSAISRRMSPNKVLGMATSAIRKAT